MSTRPRPLLSPLWLLVALVTIRVAETGPTGQLAKVLDDAGIPWIIAP